MVVIGTGNTPMTGTWRKEADETIAMVEGGHSYRTEILSLTENELRLRSHNPVESVDITLRPAGPWREQTVKD